MPGWRLPLGRAHSVPLPPAAAACAHLGKGGRCGQGASPLHPVTRLVIALARGRSLEHAAAALVPCLSTTPAAVVAGAAGGILPALLAAACVRALGSHFYPEAPYIRRQDGPLVSALRTAAAMIFWPTAEAAVVRGIVVAWLVAPAWGTPMAIAAPLPLLLLMVPPWISPLGFVPSAALTAATLAHGSLWPLLTAHIACHGVVFLLTHRETEPAPPPAPRRPSTAFGRAVLLHRIVTAAVTATAVGKATEAPFRAMGRRQAGEMAANYFTALASFMMSALRRQDERVSSLLWPGCARQPWAVAYLRDTVSGTCPVIDL